MVVESRRVSVVVARFADDHNAALPDWFVEEEKPFTRQMVGE